MLLIAPLPDAEGSQAVDGGGDLEAAGPGEVARVMATAVEGVECVETLGVEEGLDLLDDFAQDCPAVHEASGGQVDGVPHRPRLGQVDELLDAA